MRHKLKLLNLVLIAVFIFSFTGCKTAPAATTAAAVTTAAAQTTTTKTNTQPVQENGDYNIGDTGPAGGFIFYINPNYETDGWKYLEAAPNDLPDHVQWCNGRNPVYTGATATAIGTGMSNTQKIVGIQGEGNYAAKLCFDLTLNGFSDWFLPSKDELNLMYANLYLKGIGSFEPGLYQSSSEFDADSTWYQDFDSGRQGIGYNKAYAVARVRAVRAFKTAEAETIEPVNTKPETTATASAYNIGNTGPAGGLIFYVNPNYEADGWKYLEAATSDFTGDKNDYNIQWYNGNYVATGVTATAIGTGMSNTQKIVDILGDGYYAAKLCYSMTLNGYSDWFLPSKDELNFMYENLYLKGISSFEPVYYWSSSGDDAKYAWGQNFNNGDQSSNFKFAGLRVRAVRAF